MIKEIRKRQRRRRLIFKSLLTVLVVLGLAALIIFKVFAVKNVEVKGNKLYSDSRIEKWVLNDKYSWNSLYVFFKYKVKETKELPFVDYMKISMKNPHTLQIQVYEKGVLGYVYVSSLGKNAYFDKDGFVVELSSDAIEDTVKITGLKIDTAELYEKLPLKDSSVLRTLLNVTQLLDKYEIEPEIIYVTPDGEILLSYGDIQAYVGSNIYLNEKIVRLQKILPELKDMKGTLHLETWTESARDIYFTKDELTDIPNDVQSVPGESESSAANQSENGKQAGQKDSEQ